MKAKNKAISDDSFFQKNGFFAKQWAFPDCIFASRLARRKGHQNPHAVVPAFAESAANALLHPLFLGF
jgi:hypothetical protein